jgi:hypothetical protein
LPVNLATGATMIPRKWETDPEFYPDGNNGYLTKAQWFALSEPERERIDKIVHDQIQKLIQSGTV